MPKLTFLSRFENRAALAHVYVLATQQLLPAELEEAAAKKEGWLNEIVAASTHNIQIRAIRM